MRIRTDQMIRAAESSTSWFASTSNREVSFQEGVAKQLATPLFAGSLSTDYTDSTNYPCNLWIENRKSNRRSVCHGLTNMHFVSASIFAECDLCVFGDAHDGTDRRRFDRNNQHASGWQ